MTEEEKSVEDVMTTSFNIAGVPMPVFKRFIRFCEHNAKMTRVYYNRAHKREIKEELCYSIGLSQLLDRAEGDATTHMLYEKVNKVEDRLKKIEEALKCTSTKQDKK